MNRDYAYPLRVSAERYPAQIALAYRDHRWTFRELDEAVDRLASAFERRGLAGKCVVLLLQNEPTTVVTYLALARSGAIAVPVNPRLQLDEIAFVLDDCDAAALVVDGAFAEAAERLRDGSASVSRLITVNVQTATRDADRLEDLLEEAAEASGAAVDASSVALIVYTSGTSGVPKGVARSHDANLWATVNSVVGQPRFSDDIEVFVLPLFGIAFIFQVMPMLMAGGTTVLDGAFDPTRTWELLERHRASRVFLAPTMIDSMLAVDGHQVRDVSSLRILNTAYEFPRRVREATFERFGAIVAYMYGLTEAQLCCSTPAQFARDPTDAGHPMGMMSVRVVDQGGAPVRTGVVGEITMAGPSLMTGYHRRAEATAEALVDGWLYTGDLGYLDGDGRIHVAGRKKSLIKTGGFSVDPVEVENAILAFPGVQEAAVVGAPDEHWGEYVVGFVAPSSTADLDEAELTAFVRSRLAGYKCPKRLWFLPELPKNAMGKIERAHLRSLAESRGGVGNHETTGAESVQP